jgi:hypothetical protein
MPPSASAGWSCEHYAPEQSPTNEKAGAVGSGLRNSPRTWPFCAVTFFYGLVDIVLRDTCHEIIGIIAVQHKQFNFVWSGTKVAFVALLILAGQPLSAGTIVQSSRPDPLLDGGPTTPCAADTEYAAGTDANGNSVIPADVAARPVPIPDQIAIPLGGRTAPAPQRGRQPANPETLGSDGTYISLDGKKLEPLLNPPPCAASTPKAR